MNVQEIFNNDRNRNKHNEKAFGIKNIGFIIILVAVVGFCCC